MRVEAVDYRTKQKGALQGFFTIILPEISLKILNCAHFFKNGQHWFNFPQEERKTEDDKPKYFPYVRFLGGPVAEEIKTSVIQQLKEKNENFSGNSRPKSEVYVETPFDFGESPF